MPSVSVNRVTVAILARPTSHNAVPNVRIMRFAPKMDLVDIDVSFGQANIFKKISWYFIGTFKVYARLAGRVLSAILISIIAPQRRADLVNCGNLSKTDF